MKTMVELSEEYRESGRKTKKTLDKIVAIKARSILILCASLLISASSGLWANTIALDYSFDALKYHLKGNIELSNECREKVKYWLNISKTLSAPARYVFGVEYKEIK
ncbi:hypothetical protein HYT23_06825 [Candidatus Pacearchaeota archaeon]|nr:hypothetical protein [Candidatus Pacearchaeota archaeon]